MNSCDADPPEYSGEDMYTANEGSEDFKIELTLDSSPIPANFEWFFNGQPLIEGVNGVKLGVNFIQFDTVSRDHTGSYMISTSNGVGSTQFTFQLIVNCELYTLISISQGFILISCTFI